MSSFLQDLKVVCASSLGNSAFWSEVQTHDETLNLITKSEAKKHGGLSLISASEAQEVSYSDLSLSCWHELTFSLSSFHNLPVI